MQEKILLSGNEAVARGAIDGGCRFYAGYPITPQNELIAYMAGHMPDAGGIFIQSESEISAINMVFGASASGVRAMTSSSSPGISLKQEGISYIAGAQLPCVIVNVMRAGPGLGNIWPAQSDYFQAVKGGGHGDYRCLVFAPWSAQETYDLTKLAFERADNYRMPAVILIDGMIGQMMEPVIAETQNSSNSVTAEAQNLSNGVGAEAQNSSSRLDAKAAKKSQKPQKKEWAVTGCKGRKPNVIKSFYLKLGDLEEFNLKMQEKYKLVESKEQRYECFYLDDAQVILVTYGTAARLCKQAVINLRGKGFKAGMIRPITLWPFPKEVFARLKANNKALSFLAVELSYGQMVEDVRLAVNGKFPVAFLGRSAGGILTQKEITDKVKSLGPIKG